MDWRGRTREREVKLHLFSNCSASRATLPMGLAWSNARTRGKVATFRRHAQPFPWIGRGRTREREVKLHLVGVTRNPSHGLAWSNARTRGKVAHFVQHFGVTRNPYHGLAWSNARTRGKVAHFVQHFGVTRNPYHGIGVVGRPNAR